MVTHTYLRGILPSPDVSPLSKQQAAVYRSHLALIDHWYAVHHPARADPPAVVDGLRLGGHVLGPHQIEVYRKYLVERLKNVKLPL